MLRKTVLPIAAAILLYLIGAPSTQVRGQSQSQLPEGAGKQLVETTCSRCHSLGLVTSAGYSKDEWQQVFGAMVQLPADRAALAADYLAKNFPEKPKPPAVLIPGPVNVSIKEWVVPSLGSRPH